MALILKHLHSCYRQQIYSICHLWRWKNIIFLNFLELANVTPIASVGTRLIPYSNVVSSLKKIPAKRLYTLTGYYMRVYSTVKYFSEISCWVVWLGNVESSESSGDEISPINVEQFSMPYFLFPLHMIMIPFFFCWNHDDFTTLNILTHKVVFM